MPILIVYKFLVNLESGLCQILIKSIHFNFIRIPHIYITFEDAQVRLDWCDRTVVRA